jgi:hypothetical protein
MAQLRVVGTAPDGEVHDAIAFVQEVPRKGDALCVWLGHVGVFVNVDMVAWPTWGEGVDPEVYLSRDEGMSDEEWSGVFVAIQERRAP